MAFINVGDISVHVVDTGDPDGSPVVFANALGTDTRL